jgi:Na+(H+)/acetate symporter ActP
VSLYVFRAPLQLLKESWWFGISPEGFGTIAMIVNFVVAFIKSFTPEPPQDVQDIVEHIRFLLVQEKLHKSYISL